VTPDGRYFVVRGRLWRLANPDIDPDQKRPLVQDLMAARRALMTPNLQAIRLRKLSASRYLAYRGGQRRLDEAG
jgi:hypothetical protein